MPKINAIRVHDKIIELIPMNAERYGPLFEIDSVSLLLGTNGSGKTRTLISLANGVGSTQDDSFQFYFQGTPNGNYEPTSPYNENICSIYYSALPYKRRLLRRKCIINASPKSRSSTDNNRLEEFGLISKLLGIKAELIGVVSYSKVTFRTILIPAIRKSKQIIPFKLKELISYLDDIVINSPSESENYLDIDKKREFLLNDIEGFLEIFILEKLGDYDGLLYLSSLEYIYNKAGKKIINIIAIAFLVHIGILDSQSTNSEWYGFQELERIAINSKKLIDQYFFLNDRELNHRTFTCRVGNMEIAEVIKSIDSSIQIEWSNQSSGLQALVEQFSLIDDAIFKATEKNYKSVLLLIDEGDAYLHLDWQRKYISMVNKFLGGLKRKYNLDNLQLIMATHSPLLAADIPRDFVTSLDSNNSLSTFAAPIEEVIANAFSSNSLGEFAANNINEIYKRAVLGKTTDFDRHLVDSIGDISIRAALKRSFNNDY